MKKKDINEDELGSNPFVVPLSIPVRKIFKKDHDKDGIPRYGHYDLELTSGTRFYISKHTRGLLHKLPGCSAQLLLWIMQKLENGKDYIWINRTTCMDELGINSVNTYKSGIKVLCDLRFIAAIYMKPDIYFINPQSFFNGSRTRRFPDNIDEYVPKEDKIEEDAEN